MKILILMLAFNLSHNYTENNIVASHSNYVTPQQNTVRAFLLYQGSFIEGTINLQRTQFGYQPYTYNFTEIANRQTTGQFYPNTQLTPLNPNNAYALKYNFTHTVSIPNLGTAYITI